MHLIVQIITLCADPLFHLLLVAAIVVFANTARAQTLPYTCPAGQAVTSSFANIGMSCSQFSYSQISGTPTIPAAQVNSDWNSSSGVSQILNKPSIPSAQVNSDWNASSGVAQILNKPTIPSVTRTFNNPSRTLNTPFQVSATQDAYVDYSVPTACTSVLIAGQQTTVTLEYADNVGMSTNVKIVNTAANSTSGVLNAANQSPGNVHGFVPAGKYADIITSTTGTNCTVSIGAQQEVLF